MPSKRQPSKQRRAAQNRNTRVQREARAQRAGSLSTTVGVAAGRSAGPPGSGSGRPGFLGGLFGGRRSGGDDPDSGNSGVPSADDEAPDGDDTIEDREGDVPEADDDETPVERPPRPEPQAVGGKGLIATRPDGTRLPGAMATFVALVLAVLGLGMLLAAPTVAVDDRGEQVSMVGQSVPFEGLHLEARGLLETGETGQAVETESRTALEENGPAVVLLIGLPTLMTAFAWWMHRRTGLSRTLTIGMLALAFGVFVLGMWGQFFIPALIALAVGSFQARKAEMPARMAERMAMQEEREARRKRRAGETDDDVDDDDAPDEGVIDVESREEETAGDDDDDGPADGSGDTDRS